MPTHTPSPHRFLAPVPPDSQKAKSKPQSSLRNGFTAQTPKPAATCDKPELQFKKLTPAKRFVITPHRRTLSAEEHGKAKVNVDEAWETTHTQLTPRPKPPRKFDCVESIEEVSQSSPTAPPNGDNGFHILQSVEHNRTLDDNETHQDQEEDIDEILFITEQRIKRRRVSTPSEPTTLNPPTTHRFLVPPPPTTAPFSAIHTTSLNQNLSTTISTPATHHRPTFLLPPQPTSPPKPSKPLPEIFSPSRKSQKYIPGGLASTVQGWIIETANTGFVAQAYGGMTWGRDREDGVRLKVRITDVNGKLDGSAEVECFPGYFVVVRGKTEVGMYNYSRAPSVVGDEGAVRVLLAGQSGARGVGGVKIRIGGVIGVRQPMWDVEVDGEMWIVGVDWSVL